MTAFVNGLVTEPHRLALVLAGHRAVPPPGIDRDAFALACLADSYEVLADLEEVRAGIAFADQRAADDHRSDRLADRPHQAAQRISPVVVGELLWPGDLAVPTRAEGLRAVVDGVSETVAGRAAEDLGTAPPWTELLVVPADVPDLPGLVLAKVAKALHRADVVTAPEVGGDGLAAIGVRLPWPDWLSVDLDLDRDQHDELLGLAPQHSRVARVPGWHRMRRPAGVDRLDPRLEGWDQVRLLLGG